MTSRLPHGLQHGGDPSWADRTFGAPAGGWLDLSTGINPWAWPVVEKLPELSPDLWQALPTTALADETRRAAAKAYGAPDADRVAVAPGTQSLIQWLPRLRPLGSVAIVSPTYGEHVHCWRAAGHDVREVLDLADAGADSADAIAADVIVVTNPNNPDGRTYAAAHLRDVARAQADRGGWLVVDEAFADPDPSASVVADADIEGLIVLRSFGKFFGLAGLRLGFAVAAPAIVQQIERAQGPWAVSGPALEIGRRALDDNAWIAATRQRLSAAATALDRDLAAAGFEAVGGTSLFRLVDHPDAARRFEALARAGVLVRRFDDAPSRLRFGLPGDEAQVTRLRQALDIAAATPSQAAE